MRSFVQTSIQTEGFRSLAEGEPVEYFLEAGDDGRTKAVQVTGPGGAPPQVDFAVCSVVSGGWPDPDRYVAHIGSSRAGL